jgi:hypothetical protein
MLRKLTLGLLVALPLGVAGLLFAPSPSEGAGKANVAEPGFVCPITGDVLPCPKCCPLNKN